MIGTLGSLGGSGQKCSNGYWIWGSKLNFSTSWRVTRGSVWGYEAAPSLEIGSEVQFWCRLPFLALRAVKLNSSEKQLAQVAWTRTLPPTKGRGLTSRARFSILSLFLPGLGFLTWHLSCRSERGCLVSGLSCWMSVESYITDCLTKEVGKDLHTYRSEYRNACVRKWVVLVYDMSTNSYIPKELSLEGAASYPSP